MLFFNIWEFYFVFLFFIIKVSRFENYEILSLENLRFYFEEKGSIKDESSNKIKADQKNKKFQI
jgi:3-phosphoglycerate kinase